MTNKLDKWCIIVFYEYTVGLYQSTLCLFIGRPVGPLSVGSTSLYWSARRAFKLLVDTMCLLSCIHKELTT